MCNFLLGTRGPRRVPLNRPSTTYIQYFNPKNNLLLGYNMNDSPTTPPPPYFFLDHLLGMAKCVKSSLGKSKSKYLVWKSSEKYLHYIIHRGKFPIINIFLGSDFFSLYVCSIKSCPSGVGVCKILWLWGIVTITTLIFSFLWVEYKMPHNSTEISLICLFACHIWNTRWHVSI